MFRDLARKFYRVAMTFSIMSLGATIIGLTFQVINDLLADKPELLTQISNDEDEEKID
uniref:Uncharacterized protein n=1 Tax=Abalone asfa-like virus TaxID=2839893 RepID=A0A5K7Y0S8_9VIRU|nr:hypothetical protein [Abalone asfa-like virus]